MSRFIHILYVPTMNCNMKCRYCYLGENTNELKSDKGYLETSEYAHRNYNTDGGGYRRDDYEYKEYYGKSPTWTPFDE